MAKQAGVSGIGSKALAQGDLVSPFPRLGLELSKDELRDTAYEILAAACKTVSTLGKGKAGTNNASQTAPKSVTSAATSKMKKALGLRSKDLGREQVNVSSKTKRPLTAMELIRLQMGISELTDTRIRRALSRTAAGQVGKHVEMILLPLELLQQIRLADFADPREYHSWQRRQLKVLETGLLWHPAVKLDQSNNAAQRLKQLLRGSTEKPLETGKNSESMQALRSAATSLAGRMDGETTAEVCHWADGSPFNIHLYQMLLYCCFDKTDEMAVIDEIDEVMELVKKTWGILGIHEALHNACFMWILFCQFVVTGQSQLDLLGASKAQLVEVANDAKIVKDPQYVLILSSILSAIQTWSEKRFLAYHDAFPSGGEGLMENLLPVALNAAQILYEDLPQDVQRKRKEEVDVASNRVDVYVRSSLRAAFAWVMEQVDARRRSFKNEASLPPALIILAEDTANLMEKENEIFSPVLKHWHPFAAGLAAATLHSCFRNELQQLLQEVIVLTPEVVDVLKSADQLEKVLVKIAVEDAVDCEDGGKGIIREMTPFETDSAIATLSRNWIQESLDRLQQWVDRNVQREDWNPQALREHYAPSVVEVFRIVEETLDAFFALPIAEHLTLLQDLVTGIDRALHRYVSQATAGCGWKCDYLPTFPALTRCREAKHYNSFGGLWKKKERCVGFHRGKGQLLTNGSHKAGTGSFGLPHICVRINTLYYIQTELELLEKRICNSWRKDAGLSEPLTKMNSSESDTVCTTFEQVRTGVREGIQRLCEVAVYRVVFQDLRTVFWEGLYSGGVAHARISQVLEQLDEQLETIADTVHEQLRNCVVSALMMASFEGLLMVLLAGGPSRVFFLSDADMLDEDFAALKDLFKADGEGLPSEVVEKAARTLTQIVPLFSMDTVDLIETFKSALSEACGANSNGSKLPLPGTTGQWSPRDANTLLCILCHRCDKMASTFLKKTYNLPKS
eukprot:c26066_g2_i1 orf=115-3015(-)